MPRRGDASANIVSLSAKRIDEIVAASRIILASEGAEALTMRRLAGELGIQAPSTPAAGSSICCGSTATMPSANPTCTARVTADATVAQALWSFAHGMVILELDGRYPPGSDLDATWLAGAQVFQMSIVD
jgi:hypothetical protein